MKKLVYTLFFVLISVVANGQAWNGSQSSKWYGDVSGGNSKWSYWR